MTNATTETIIDIDGSILAVRETRILINEIKAETYRKPDAIEPHEVVLRIGDTSAEMKYTEEVAKMLGQLETITAARLFALIARNPL